MDSEEAPPRPSKILVVDDNDQNRELLEAHVQDLSGVTVISAVDGTDALEAVAREHPDLILLDIMMPKMSGFEVCRRLKSDPSTKDIPVVMVTALNEIADHEKGIECGCDDFLSKPVNRLELVKRIQSLLRIRHLKSQLDRTMALIKKVPGQEVTET